jgi:hypothetical protein
MASVEEQSLAIREQAELAAGVWADRLLAMIRPEWQAR